jgi:hypothetical protein
MNISNRISEQWGKRFTFIFYAFVFVAAVTVVLTFILSVNGDDGWIHLNWLDQFTRLFREGNLYPRWMPESFSRYGSAAFYFYPPLSYWTAAIISVILPSASPEVLLFSISILASILTVVSMRSYLREAGMSSDIVLLGGLIYGFGAYRIFDIFSRNAMSEHFAMIFLPLLFQAIEVAFRSTKKEPLRVYILFTSGFLGMLLSNIPTLVAASIAAGIYCIVRIRKDNLKNIFPLPVGILTSLLMGGMYILPMIMLRPEAHFENLFNLGAGFSAGKIPVGFLISLVFLDTRIIAAVSILLSILCFIVLIRYKMNAKDRFKKEFAMGFIFLFLFIIVVQIPYIGFYIHSRIFPFTLLQFYWRWNIVLAFAIPAVIMFFLTEKRYLRFSFLVLVILLITIGVTSFLQFLNTSPAASLTYHRDVREYIPHDVKNLPAVHDKYGVTEPAWVDSDQTQTILPQIKGITLKKIDAYNYIIQTSFDSDQTVTFHQFYWKHWKLQSNDDQELIMKPDSLGKATAYFVSGVHTYSYKLYQSEPEKYGAMLSGFGLCTFLLMIIIYKRQQKLKTKF